MSKKNSWIELYRFIFLLSILFLHFFSFFEIEPIPFRGAFFSVEFFFLVSGFFLGKSTEKAMKDKGFTDRLKCVPDYVIKRLKRLYPMYFAALILALLIKKFTHSPDYTGFFNWIKEGWPEFLMLQWTPLSGNILIGILWFIPSIFFGGLVLTFLASFFGKNIEWFGFIVCPLIAFADYAFFFITIGKIDVIVSHYGIMRGIGSPAMGWFLYKISGVISKRIGDSSDKAIPVFALFAHLIMAGVLIYENFTHKGPHNMITIIILSIGLICLSLGNLPVKEKTEKIFMKLGSLTFVLYIFHMPFYEILNAILSRL